MAEPRGTAWRPFLLIAAGIALLVGYVVVSTHDEAAVAEWLVTGYVAESEGALLFGEYSKAFDTDGGPSGVAAFPSTPRGKVAIEELRALGKDSPRPWFMKRDLVRDIEVGIRAHVALLAEPRGSWMTYSKEIADSRGALERTLIAAEVAVGNETTARSKQRIEMMTSQLAMKMVIAENAARPTPEPEPTAIPIPTATVVPTAEPYIASKIPSGYAGLKWGAPKPKDGFVLASMANDTSGYRRHGDRLKFGAMEVWDVVYLFRGNAFAGVGFEVSAEKQRALIDEATRAFGPQVAPFVRKVGKPGWLADESFAFVELVPGANRARLLVGSREYWNR